jgi:hypothetical protein
MLLLTSCGGGAPLAQPASAPTTVTQTSTGTEVHIASDAEAVGDVVEGTPTRVWAALLQVYEEARIPVTEQDAARQVMGNPRFVTRGRLLGHPMSRYLSCGQGPTGMYADVSRIEMSIHSSVTEAGPGKVQVRTLVEAVARNMEGNSNTRTACASYNRLEMEIVQRVRERLAGS